MKRSMDAERDLSDELVMYRNVVEESRETVWSTRRPPPNPFTTPMQFTPRLVTPPSTHEPPSSHHPQQQFRHVQNTIVRPDLVVDAFKLSSMVLFPFDQTLRNMMPPEYTRHRHEEMDSSAMHPQISDELDDETLASMRMPEFNNLVRFLSREETIHLRQRRRAAKNRQYARRSRERQIAKMRELELRKTLLDTENSRLQLELYITAHERDVYKDCVEVLQEAYRREDSNH